MTKVFLILASLCVCNISQAQIKALTENGKEVTLNDDGTWRYSDNENPGELDSISVNLNKFTKDANAKFLVKSNVFNVGVYINPSKWVFRNHKDNER